MTESMYDFVLDIQWDVDTYTGAFGISEEEGLVMAKKVNEIVDLGIEDHDKTCDGTNCEGPVKEIMRQVKAYLTSHMELTDTQVITFLCLVHLRLGRMSYQAENTGKEAKKALFEVITERIAKDLTERVKDRDRAKPKE